MGYLLIAYVAVALTGQAVTNDHASSVDLRRLSADSALSQEAVAQAQKWRQAILDRDVGVIVSYAFPEDRERLRRVLTQPKSPRYLFVFGSSKYSLRRRVVGRDQVIMFQWIDMPASSPIYVTACYATPVESSRNWPPTNLALRRYTVKANIPCQVFIKRNGAWWATIEGL